MSSMGVSAVTIRYDVKRDIDSREPITLRSVRLKLHIPQECGGTKGESHTRWSALRGVVQGTRIRGGIPLRIAFAH
jgi:hypothetical protein